MWSETDLARHSLTVQHSDTRITRDIYQSVFPEVAKGAAEAAAGLVPLQRKTKAKEAEKRRRRRPSPRPGKKARSKIKGATAHASLTHEP